jgi:hypothetical protein
MKKALILFPMLISLNMAQTNLDNNKLLEEKFTEVIVQEYSRNIISREPRKAREPREARKNIVNTRLVRSIREGRNNRLVRSEVRESRKINYARLHKINYILGLR